MFSDNFSFFFGVQKEGFCTKSKKFFFEFFWLFWSGFRTMVLNAKIINKIKKQNFRARFEIFSMFVWAAGAGKVVEKRVLLKNF